MTDYRPVREDRTDDFRRIVEYGFRPTEGPFDPAEGDDPDEKGPSSVGEERGLFSSTAADAELLCVCKQLFFELRVRGAAHEAVGLAAVASPPEHRRKGLVGELLAESLREYRERGRYLSVLWPFEYAFYRRFGWETLSRFGTVECAPEVLSFAEDAAAGMFHELSADEFDRLAPVYRAHAGNYDATLVRTEEWWRNRVFRLRGTDPYVYGWERDGDLRGYLVYRIDEDAEDGRTMRVRDHAFLDHEAYLNLLRLCYYHDSQVSNVRLYGPPDPSLMDLVDDRNDVDCEIHGGPMVRLADVPTALEALSSPADGRLCLRVEDDLAGWNDDTFVLAVSDGRVSVSRRAVEPDVRTDVATLSSLYAGYYGVEAAERAGDLTVHRPDARGLLAALFPPTETYLREFF